MPLGRTQGVGTRAVEAFKNWLHTKAEDFRHFKIEFFGTGEEKKNLKSLDQIKAEIIDIHVRSRKLENSISLELKNPSTSNRVTILENISGLRVSLLSKKTFLERMHISDTPKGSFIKKKESGRNRSDY